MEMDDSNITEISEAVKTFMNRNQSAIDIKRTNVPEKRKMVIYIRKDLERFPERMTWKDKPSYWSENVCFGDPNNRLKKDEYVTEMLLFLVDEWRRRHQLEPLDNPVPVPSGIPQPSSSAGDWQPNDQYTRIMDHLRALPIPALMLYTLIGIVEFWVTDTSTYHAEAHDLEAIVDKMKTGSCSSEQSVVLFQKFIDKYKLPSVRTRDDDFSVCEDDRNGEDPFGARRSVNEAAESAGMAVHSIQETRIILVPEDSVSEPVLLREDPKLEGSSSLEEISARLVEDLRWLTESICRHNESLEEEVEEEHRMHFCEDDRRNLPQDLCLVPKTHCELELELISDKGDDEMRPCDDLLPILSYWKNMTGINLNDINGPTLLRYLKKMVENHPTFCIHDFHQLNSNVALAWSDEKTKLLLPYEDASDRHFSLLFADRGEGIVSVLDSVQTGTDKLKQLKQSFVNHFPITNGNLLDWRSVEIECPRLKRDSELSDICLSAYFTLMFAEAIVNGMKPVEFRQEFIPEFKVWLDYTLSSDHPVPGLFAILSRLSGNCGVCSRVEPFPNFLKLMKQHAVT